MYRSSFVSIIHIIWTYYQDRTFYCFLTIAFVSFIQPTFKTFVKLHNILFFRDYTLLFWEVLGTRKVLKTLTSIFNTLRINCFKYTAYIFIPFINLKGLVGYFPLDPNPPNLSFAIGVSSSVTRYLVNMPCIILSPSFTT